MDASTTPLARAITLTLPCQWRVGEQQSELPFGMITASFNSASSVFLFLYTLDVNFVDRDIEFSLYIYILTGEVAGPGLVLEVVPNPVGVISQNEQLAVEQEKSFQ